VGQLETCPLRACRKYPKLAQESWRRHGLLNPPTNPFLKDEVLPRQRKWGERRSG
jgi:hypothetical protein